MRPTPLRPADVPIHLGPVTVDHAVEGLAEQVVKDRGSPCGPQREERVRASDERPQPTLEPGFLGRRFVDPQHRFGGQPICQFFISGPQRGGGLVLQLDHPAPRAELIQDLFQEQGHAAFDAQWRLLFALSRFGGLRCPSEHLALRWSDVDWGRGRIRIPSPKTEHHEGGESREIPIFPELRPHLEAVWFDPAQEGAEFVITRYRQQNSNLRTQLQRIIQRAGLNGWPKLFQNLRASRATELAEQFPGHVAAAWLGHTEAIANKHYRQVTDEHFAAAMTTRNPTQHLHATSGNGSPEEIGGASDSDSWQSVASEVVVLQ